MMDALGFKGIWKKPGHKAEEITQMLQAIADFHGAILKSALAELESLNVEPNIKMSFLSDTVVIGVSLNMKDAANNEHATHLAALLASQFASAVQLIASQAKYPLAYRGAISMGDFVINHPFIVGPAVDDAASHMEMADAAVVWTTPSLRDHLEQQEVDNEFLFRFRVPLKGLGMYDTYVVNPFGYCGSGEDVAEATRSIMKTMTGVYNVAVDMKRQNTSMLDAVGMAMNGTYDNPMFPTIKMLREKGTLPIF